jgi:hypothetical protein
LNYVKVNVTMHQFIFKAYPEVYLDLQIREKP